MAIEALKKRVLLIANIRARTGKTGVGAAAGRLREHGFTVDARLADDPASIGRTISEHCVKNDVVVVGGGDGTLNAAAPALLVCQRPLGILPLGTANDLARTLKIPADPARAMDIVANGRLHRVDVGRANAIPFFNVASVGLSTEITRHLSQGQKRRFGALAYARAAVAQIWRADPFFARIDCDGEHVQVRSLEIAVGNGRYHGGGTPVAAQAEIDEGELFLYSIPPQPWWQLAALVPALRRGAQGTHRRILLLHGRAIDLSTPRPMSVDTDGELTTTTPVHFTVERAALTVLVPEEYFEERARRAAR